MEKLRNLKGLGVRSEQSLAAVRIYTPEDLRTIGPVMAYYRIKMHARDNGHPAPGLKLMYALVGSVTDRSWSEVMEKERETLIAELRELESWKRLFV